MPDHHVGDDVALRLAGQVLGRARLQRQDQAHRLGHVGLFGLELAGDGRMVMGGQCGHAGFEDPRRQVATGAGRGQGGQLRGQAFAGIARGQAGRLALQQALADRFHMRARHVEAGDRAQQQRRVVAVQVAGVVAVLQPEPGDLQVAGRKFEGQALQYPDERVAGARLGDALHPVLALATPAGAGHVPHGRLGQFVEGCHLHAGGLGGGAGRIGRGGLALLVQLQHRVQLKRARDFHLQLLRVELQQADGLQQLRRQVELLPQLCGLDGLHLAFP